MNDCWDYCEIGGEKFTQAEILGECDIDTSDDEEKYFNIVVDIDTSKLSGEQLDELVAEIEEVSYNLDVSFINVIDEDKGTFADIQVIGAEISEYECDKLVDVICKFDVNDEWWKKEVDLC